jgi:peptidyl-prolyl cis-trans isomerase SurA
MKNIIQIAVLLAFLLPFMTKAQGDKAVIDKIVASVGGEIIFLSELQEQISYARERQPTLPEGFECEALQNLVMQKLLVNQAKLDSIEIKDEEVETQLDARIERLLSYFNQDPKGIEDYYGQTIDVIKEQMRGDMRNQILAERMQGEITSKATITPSEVKEFFKKIPKDSLPYFNAEVEIREIVHKPKVNATQKGIAREKIDDIRKRIVEGKEDFGALAKKYSDDPGSGAQNGDLGWQKRGTFVPEFEAMAYKLDKDQISTVVESEFGFHIIQLIERRGNLIHARHVLIKPTITEEDLELAKSKLDSVRTRIMKDSMPFSVAVKLYSDKNVQSYNNDGRVANPRSGNTFYEMADLPTNIFFAIDGIKTLEVSKPVESSPEEGDKFFRIVMVQSRTKPHKADLKQDYNKIQTAALEQKKASFTEKWVVERLRNTYLQFDSLYGSCPNLIEMKAQAQAKM